MSDRAARKAEQRAKIEAEEAERALTKRLKAAIKAGPAADAAGVGWTHYQYNGYCNVPCGQGQNTCKPMPGTNRTCLPGMPCAFGACIT